MDPPNRQRDDGDDDDDDNENDGHGGDHCFIDAQDDFPFHDCSASDQSVTSTSSSTITEPSPEVTSPGCTLRRRSKVSGSGCEDSIQDTSSAGLITSQNHDSRRRNRGKRCKFYRDLKGKNKNVEGTESTWWSNDQGVDVVGDDDEKKKDESAVTTAADDRVNDSVDSTGALDDSASPNLLTLVAGLVIKAIGFQFSLFICFITFPLWVLYHCYMLVVDPFGAVRRSRGFLMLKLVSVWNFIGKSFSSLMGNWLTDQKTLGELLLRVGWGLFWSIYVGTVLCGLFAMAIISSGFLVRFLVEEPMQLRENMNFDYTKPSPVAFVPIMSCDELGCGENCKDGIVDAMSLRTRAIPRNHKLQVRVLLTLPESVYNRNLGIFQVRVDFLSADGKTLASKSQPSMLKFRSDPIRLLLTLLEIVPLLAGYVSESQNLELKIRGFTEGDVPTSCLKVTIEQRAVFQPGAGIPEIYDASLVLESELPFLKRIMWYWKKTLFIWIAISAFMTEFLLTLICCRPLIIPKVRLRGGSTIINVPER